MSKDSAGYPVLVGEADITGIAGDSVVLDLAVDSAIRATVGRAARVDVTTATSSGGIVMRGVLLDSLIGGVVVFRFARGTLQIPDTAHVAYALPRVFDPVSPLLSARLTQRVSPNAAVISWLAPWAPPAAAVAPRMSTSASTCSVISIGAPGTICGITVGIRPYVPAIPWLWGAFQSDYGTGRSHAITITFSAPVRSVTITVEDPSIPGNLMEAFDASGALIGRQEFSYSGRAGLNIPSTRTISAPGIMSVFLAVPVGDYVAYDDIIFEPDGGSELAVTCTPAQVVRGAPTLCKASLSDGATPAVTAWHFASTDTLLPTFGRDGPAGTTWGGVMVISGTVTATATVAGKARMASSGVKITARNWSADTVAYMITDVSTKFVDPPANEHALGNNSLGYRNLPEGYATVESGPNEGLAYFTRLPYAMIFDVEYNTKAMQSGSTFWNMQPKVGTRMNDTTFCARAQVLDDIPRVKAHEGFKMTDLNSHTEVYARYFLRSVRTEAEQLVASDITTLNSSRVGNAAHLEAARQSELVTHAAATNPYTTNCSFNYDQTRRIK